MFLTEEVEPAVKAMRTAAAELRRDALASLEAADRERFVDMLLAIKANLSRQENGVSKNAASGRKR